MFLNYFRHNFRKLLSTSLKFYAHKYLPIYILVYVDASESCNTLSFHLSDASTVTPMWSIIVTQYSNDYANKAPPNCLQYHFGSATGQIRSFNWNEGNGRHLANQNQLICIRREKTMNRICYSQAGGAVLNDFLISTGVNGDSASAQSGLNGVNAHDIIF